MSYRHIFFDLDHTLWDFDKNSSIVLQLLFDQYELKQLSLFTPGQFIQKFCEVNDRLWDLYRQGSISKEMIRTARFRIIFRELNAGESDFIDEIARDYLVLCPLQKNVIPFAHELLEYLLGKYFLHIITNGFEEVQYIKMKSAQLIKYFDTIITSDICGFIKPDKRMFGFALEKAGAHAEESLMVGDNLDVDIAGAIKAGMDAIFFNPGRTIHMEPNVREISCLSDLMKIL